MDKLIKEIIEFRDERDWGQFHSPENLAKSVVIEAAELLECFQWNSDFDLEEVEEELADVMTYCLLLCERLNLDSRAIIQSKLEKSKLKYPVSKAKGVSTKYNKL